MKKSSFWTGLTPEQYSFIDGLNETVEDKTLIRPHTRYVRASTDYAQGISFRKLGVSSDGLGICRLPLAGPAVLSGFGRGMGIFQFGGQSTTFMTYFATPFPTSPAFPKHTVNELDTFLFSTGNVVTSFTLNGPTGNPLKTSLPCHVFTNFVDAITDYQFFKGYWTISGTATQAPIIQQGIAPTLAPAAGGALNNSYAYCYTFVDANGNESQPSPLGTIDSLVNNKVTITVTPTGITQGVWTIIRIYRTLENAATVVATSNPTFYNVPGLDTAVTGAGSYTITDNVLDSVLQLPTNYQLTNVSYFNGELANLPTTFVSKFSVGWNNQLWGGYWLDTSGPTEYPIRVYWSAAVDNSQTSTGCCTSWNSLNYIDVGTLDDGKIIGMWPGLQGHLYVFKENSTYIIEPTGAVAGIVYAAIPVSNEFGLYHHSISEIGGAVIGRAKDTVMVFNGSVFKPAGSAPLLKTTLGRCIQPEGDSGVYDSTTQRYYLAMCDSKIRPSYESEILYNVSGPTNAHITNLINCYRNTTLVYDFPTGNFELHSYSPVQTFGLLKDYGGRPKVFATGMSSDVFVLVNGNSFGASFSNLCSITSPTQFQTEDGSFTHINPMANYFIYVPYHINTDGNVQFENYASRVNSMVLTGDSPSSVSINVADPIPDYTSGNISMVSVPLMADTVAGLSGDTATMTTQNYNNLTISNYSLFDITSGTTLDSPIDGIQEPGADPRKIDSIGGFGISGLNPAPGDKVIILPYRYFDTLGGEDKAFQAFLTPPFGIRTNDMAIKVFEYFRAHMKGTGTLYVDGFNNGNETYKWGPYSANYSPDETHNFVINSNPTTIVTPAGNPGYSYQNYYQQMVNLKGLTGYYMRFLIWAPKSSVWFEIQDFTCYSREQEELASI